LPARIVPFQVVSFCSDRGFNEEALFPLRDIFDAAEADMWVFLNPGTLLAFFLVNGKESHKADQLVVALSEFVSCNPENSTSGIGQSEGPLLAVFNWLGQLKTAPLGRAVSKSIALARTNTPRA
jgi:hypothetical protein